MIKNVLALDEMLELLVLYDRMLSVNVKSRVYPCHYDSKFYAYE